MTRKTSLVYAVYWEAEEVFKVGVASSMHRVRAHVKRGGRAMLVCRGRDRLDESVARHVLGKNFRPAFARWQDAQKVLGPAGSGYSECFRVVPERLPEAVGITLHGLSRRG